MTLCKKFSSNTNLFSWTTLFSYFSFFLFFFFLIPLSFPSFFLFFSFLFFFWHRNFLCHFGAWYQAHEVGLKLKRPICLYLPSARIKGVNHYCLAQLDTFWTGSLDIHVGIDHIYSTISDYLLSDIRTSD